MTTHLGLRRTGKVTDFRVTTITIYGLAHHFPEAIILDGEEADPVPWDSIATIKGAP